MTTYYIIEQRRSTGGEWQSAGLAYRDARRARDYVARMRRPEDWRIRVINVPD